MIIAEQQLDQVYQKIFAKHDRLKNFDNLPPARVRVLVRLPGADEEITDAHLKVVLYVQYVQQDSPLHLPTWIEEGRLVLSQEEARVFQVFDAILLADMPYNLRVEFSVTQLTPEGEQEVTVGYANTTLSDIISADEERLDVDLMDMSNNKIPDACAELSIDWLKFAHDEMALEIHIRIQKTSGWPFSSARPFFVLYKWERELRNWTPFYRSEVLSKGIAYLDSKGPMIFELVRIKVNSELGGDENMRLRLEFFHFVSKEDAKMLGYLETSLRDLRVSRKLANLQMELSTFAEGELFGNLRMVKSKISAGRSFFCLEAKFGGEIVGDFVYFDLSVTDAKGKRGWRRKGKPFYTIARYGDSKVWEKVYRSESATRVMGKLYKFTIAKLSERRLNGNKITRPISIMLFQNIDGRRMVIGHIETTVAVLLDADAGAVLPLGGAGNGHGYVRIEQTEETDGRIYFGLHCVLERNNERSTSTEEGVEDTSAG